MTKKSGFFPANQSSFESFSKLLWFAE